MGNDNLDNNPLIAAIFGSEAARKLQENEYINKKDGFIYCSICKMPKQSRIGGFLHPMQCECERKEREEAEAEEKKYKHRQAVSKRKADCFGSNSKYADCIFANCDNGVNTKITEFCFNYCVNWREMKKENISLIFCGNVGRGKTHLAACICNKLIEDYEARVKLITENEFLERYSIIQDRGEYLNELLSYSLLVIDEMGIQTFKGNAAATGYLPFLEDLINRRYNANKPLIITSNLPKTFFINPSKDNVVNRIVSRLKEMAAEPIIFNGEDLRAKKQKEKIERLKKSLNDKAAGKPDTAPIT